MSIITIIIADIFVAAVAVMAVHEYFGLKRYDGFTVPFTKKMVELGIIESAKGERILKEDRIGCYIGIVLSVIVWLMLAKFIAGISAIPVFIAVVAVQLIVLKPESEPIDAARNRYFNSHKKDIDAMKYHEYLNASR